MVNTATGQAAIYARRDEQRLKSEECEGLRFEVHKIIDS